MHVPGLRYEDGSSKVSGNLMGRGDSMDWGGMLVGGIMDLKSGDAAVGSMVWGDVMS